MAFDIKAATPDTSLAAATGFVFGADTQSSTDPSIYSLQTLWTALTGSTTVNGATVTTSKPVLDFTQTWNDSGVAFTGLSLNITNTASAGSSKLTDLQVGGASKFSVRVDGQINHVSGGVWPANGNLQTSIIIAENYHYSRSDDICYILGSNDDIRINRDAAYTLALRFGTNPNIFNIYNTYTNASNHERVKMGWNANAFEIKPEAAGTGTTRVIHISGLPTANPGPGILWNNAGTPAIGT